MIISRNNDPCSIRNGSPLDFLFILCRYLLKPEMTWNDLQWVRNDLQRARNSLKRPTTSKKRPETTYNEQETTWNYPQQVRLDLQWPEHTYNEQRKDVKRSTTSTFSDYVTMWSKQFPSLTFFSPNIWLQSFEHCFTKNQIRSELLDPPQVLPVEKVSYYFALWIFRFESLFFFK